MEERIQLIKPMKLEGQVKSALKNLFKKIKTAIIADMERAERIHQAIDKQKEEVIQMSIRHGINLNRFY